MSSLDSLNIKRSDKAPLVSILMPCYNSALFLEEALDSVLSQTYHNLEIILIDDGSSDNTTEILQRYALKDSRVKCYFNETNLGLVRNLNKAFRLSSGKFIARMDSDDISLPSRVQVLVDVLLRDSTLDLVSAGYYTFFDKDRKMQRVFPKACTPKGLKFVSLFLNPLLHACVVFRRSLFENDTYDDSFLHSEDYEIFSRLLFKGYNFCNVMEPLYIVRKNLQSVSHKYETIQISTHNRISYRNINHYFNIQYDYFVQRVMTNRINFSVPPSLLKGSVANLKHLRNEFIKREKATTSEILDIDGFLTEQLIDIYIQSLKNSSGFLKIYHFWNCTVNLHLLFSNRGWQYLKSKSWVKRK